MMKNLLIIFILTFTIIACKENSSEKQLNETIEYYPNNPKVVFKKTIHKTDFDSVYYFYDDGLVFKKGKQYKENQKFGIWELYDRDSNLREIREWFTIQGNSHINRTWHLNKKRDTLAWRYQDSIYKQKEFFNDTTALRNTTYNYFEYQDRDTLKLGVSFKALAEMHTRVLEEYGSEVMVVLAKENANFNYDFSNYNEVKLDTFFNAQKDTLNRRMFNPDFYEESVAFWQEFDKPGPKTLRGFVLELTHKYPITKDSFATAGSRAFFERKIYIKDTIE